MDKEKNKKLPETNKETLVEIHMPSCVQIELVQGNELRHYEIFFSLSSFSLSIAVGFWTAYITSLNKSNAILWSALAFTLLALISGIIAFYYRLKVYSVKIKKVATLDKFTDPLE